MGEEWRGGEKISEIYSVKKIIKLSREDWEKKIVAKMK